jgi:hypothetical protein
MLSAAVCAQTASTAPEPPKPEGPKVEEKESAKVEFVCPMDPDVRSLGPAKCPRCGMKLLAGLPQFEEYRVEVKTQPASPKPGQPVELIFRVLHPKTGKLVKNFDVVHDKLFHLFLLRSDLSEFAHEHPELQPDGTFRMTWTFASGGLYRILTDFYPAGATPQLIASSLLLPGAIENPKLSPTTDEQVGENLRVKLRTEPAKPVAGFKTMMFFELDTADGLQPYLGAWGHMLAASSDTVDLIHAHPAFDQVGKTIQFNVIFPRAGMHRIWVQFQRSGKVNTVAFNVPVDELR